MFRKAWAQAVRRLRPPDTRPLVAPAARRRAVGLIALCVVITAVLGALFAHQGRPDGLDRAVDNWVQAGLGHHPALLNVVGIGNPVPVTLITVALVLVCLATRRWRGAALVAVAEPVAAALTESLLKPLIHRTLHGALSFPSGHTTGMFALAGACMILLIGPSHPRIPAAWRVLLVVAGYLIATAVAAGMVGLGAHYFTDTVAGGAVGTAVVLVTAFIVDRIGQPEQPPRRFPVRPLVPERAVPR